MSMRANGQGAGLRPSLLRSKQTTLLHGKPLRPDGYLFKHKVQDNLAQAHLLGTTVQARRMGALHDYVAPAKYLTLCEKIDHKVELKCQATTADDLRTVGHELTIHEQWPRLEPTGHLRVLHVNAHGLNPSNNNLECDYFIQQMAQNQVDLPMVVEVNQPLANGTVRANLSANIKHFDKHARVQFGHPDTPTKQTGWQMGGQMSFLQGGAAGLLNDTGRDSCGRWTWSKIGEPNLCIISAYRVGPGTDGINTIRAVEMRHLMQQRHPLAKTPRKAFDHDMVKFVTKQKASGAPVLLLMDANSDINSKEMKQFMKETGLKNVFTALHPFTPPPRTYDRGKSCLDMALGCNEAIDLVKAIGYLPFYELGPDDHRAMYLDLYYDKLKRKECKEDPTRANHAVPSLRRPADVRRFIEKYKMLLEKSKLMEKVAGIQKRFAVATDTERQFLAQRLNKYDAVWVQLALAAVRTTGSKIKGTRAWSPIFAHKGAICRYWNARLRILRTTGKVEAPDLRIPAKYIPPQVTSESELHQQYVTALQAWHQVKGKAADFRTQHLEDLIQFHSERRDIKRETAVKQILHWEEIRNLHGRQSRMMTSSKPRVIRTLLVPRPHSEDPTALMEVTDPACIQQIILARNASKLAAAHGSPFTTPLLTSLVGEHGDTQAADDILNGTYDTSEVDKWTNVKHRRELKLFLRHLQRPRDSDGKIINDMEWDYGADEFRDTFAKKREDTSCGPSGITMQFYRMFCLDDDLATLHATFIYLPFKYGFSLKRWQNSVHFMLMKIEVPLWEKLRIIQLLEGDFNGGLRYIFGRKLMHFSVLKKTSSDVTYGGRPGRSCHDALLRIQLSMEYCRLARIMTAFMDIDAKACFDNQIRNLISMNTRRLGVDKNASKCQTETLEKMDHRTRIQQGVSKTSISHSKEKPLYGSGQGSGAGVVNWHGHNETLIAMYEETQPGCLMTSPDGKLEQNQQVVSFVDDNKLIRAFLRSFTIAMAMKACTISINFWRKSLEVTGGALDPKKCKMQLLAFDFDTYSRKNFPNRGKPTMVKAKDQEGDCLLFDGEINDYHEIDKLDPAQGRKLLGVRLAANGNCMDEFRARKTQSEKFALQLAQSGATPVDAYMIYVFRYCPAVFYCIPITYFTPAQCNQIQSPFMTVLLPKLRINRHVKRAVVWGPTRYGGLDLKHMETEQIARTVESLIGHVRAATPTGNTFVIACETYQILLGLQQPFLCLDPEICPHRPSSMTSKITYIWETLRKINGYISLPKMWTPERRDTPCIMDAVLQARIRYKGTVKHITQDTVMLVNACRLWLQALHIEDLFDDDGMISKELFNGHRQCDTTLIFPHQERPPEWVWKIWRQTLIKVCIIRETTTESLRYLPCPIDLTSTVPRLVLPKHLDTSLSLRDLVCTLPTPYQHLLGDIEYPADDGEALAKAIADGRATMYTDGTVDEGCGAHAYSVRTDTDEDDEALSGAALTWGDPETINSLRTEHFAVIAGLLWTWLVMEKYNVKKGTITGAVDNLTMVNRINEGCDIESNVRTSVASDRDVWEETNALLKRMPITCNLRHVKGHQDDMHKKGYQGPLPRDAYWNVQMDKKAEQARLPHPTLSPAIFGTSAAEFIHDGHPVHSKISQKIRKEFLAPPLREFIQLKEDWTDEVFDAVDWRAFEVAMNKMTIHKRINIAKYIFNWQNTGKQKQLFKTSAAITEDRIPQCVGMCPMKCGESETPQHFLQCTVLHDSKVIQRDFYAIRKWLEKHDTHREMSLVLVKGLTHWMKTGTAKSVWDLQHSQYREDLENAIQTQNYIGWDNLLKGRVATDWGDLQMKHYEDIYDDGVPKYISATWWTSELIRQLLYFSLAIWQQRNNYLHDELTQAKKIEERTDAVEEMAKWYERKYEFPSEDRLNFTRSFLERCTDTTAQIRLWLGKIVDIHKYNMQTTLRGYFSAER